MRTRRKRRPARPKEITDHFERLSEFGCMVCQQVAVIHHCQGGSMKDIGVHKGKSQKNNDWLTIPLCPNHHNGDDGIHTIGVFTWEAKHSCQVDFLQEVSQRLGYNVLKKGGVTCNTIC